MHPDARRRQRQARGAGRWGPEGPESCSGLDVVRYDAEAPHGEFGSPFRKIDSVREVHTTPWGSEQEFVYCFCLRLDG